MEVISVKDVKKSFDHLDVLKGISFTVNEGEVVCLIGPSGSGKSTMLRCINLLEDIDSGVITVLGEDISKLSDINAFRLEDGKIRCPFTSLPGLGESAAIPIVEARKDGAFLSVEDLQNRGHVGSSVIEILRTHGALEGMAESNQLSMF